MLSAHVHIICLSSLTLLVYPIIHNLVSAHCLHTHILSMSSVYFLEIHMLMTCHLEGEHVVRTCTHHLLVISNTACIPYYPQLSFCTLSTHTHIVNVICILFRNSYVDDMSSGRGADDMSSRRGADDMSSGRGADDIFSSRGVDKI